MRPLLSIIIPSYNRKKLLKRCLNSIKNNFNKFEVILVDDGSNYNVKKFISIYKKKIDIKIFRIQNSGRTFALCYGIKKAKGKFTIILDDDDKFLKSGLNKVLATLKNNENYNNNFFVFGTIIKKKSKIIRSTPSKNINNYLKIIADQKIKTDMKEVVSTDILKNIIKHFKIKKFERIPTGLIWALVSKKNSCISIDCPVVQKEYLKGGITSKINFYKLKNPIYMQKLYLIYYNSKEYNSLSFRCLAIINYLRYSLHANKKINFNLYKSIFYIFSLIIFYVDLINLKINEKKNKNFTYN